MCLRTRTIGCGPHVLTSDAPAPQVTKFYSWLCVDKRLVAEGTALDPEITERGIEIRNSARGPGEATRLRNFLVALGLIHSFANTRWHGTVPLSRTMTVYMFCGFESLMKFTLDSPKKGTEYSLAITGRIDKGMRTSTSKPQGANWATCALQWQLIDFLGPRITSNTPLV